jgi:FkbM family methyltransferase
MFPAPTDIKQTVLRVAHTDRQFSLAGSALDQSVVGAIDKAKGVWEPHVTKLMTGLIKPEDVCLDIGANVGVYTLVMSDLARGGRVHAFEPSSMNFRFLQKNTADNGLTNATAHHLALGNQIRSAGCSFAEDKSVDRNPDRIIQRAWGQRWMRITERVQFTTLDHWVAQNGITRVDFVKMDVEGSERFVIEGGEATFKKCKPILFTELNAICLQQYFNLPPESYFSALRALYPYIYVLQPEGAIEPVASFAVLSPSLTAQRWWADLLCMNRPL